MSSVSRKIVPSGLIAALCLVLGACQQTQAPLEYEDSDPTPGTTNPTTGVQLADAGSYWRWQGDMLLEKADPTHAKVVASLKSGEAKPRGRFEYWPNDTIRFVFTGGWTTDDTTAVRAGMKAFNDASRLVFYRVLATGPKVVEFAKTASPGTCGASGSATIGYVEHPRVEILPDEIKDPSIVLHRLMHVAGFAHETLRPGRDSFVVIDRTNLTDSAYADLAQFFQDTGIATSYDVGSVLQAGSFATGSVGCGVLSATKTILKTTRATTIPSALLGSIDRLRLSLVYGGYAWTRILQLDATSLFTLPSSTNPRDIGASEQHVYVNYADHVDQILPAGPAVLATRNAVLDGIDYVDDSWGLVGYSNTLKKFTLNIFGTPTVLPYPSDLSQVNSMYGQTVSGQLHLVLMVPSTSSASTAAVQSYRLDNGALVSDGPAAGLGSYIGSEFSTDGSKRILPSGMYQKWLGDKITPPYTAHGFLLQDSLKYYDVGLDHFDWNRHAGVGGIYSLTRIGDLTVVAFAPAVF